MPARARRRILHVRFHSKFPGRTRETDRHIGHSRGPQRPLQHTRGAAAPGLRPQRYFTRESLRRDPDRGGFGDPAGAGHEPRRRERVGCGDESGEGVEREAVLGWWGVAACVASAGVPALRWAVGSSGCVGAVACVRRFRPAKFFFNCCEVGLQALPTRPIMSPQQQTCADSTVCAQRHATCADLTACSLPGAPACCFVRSAAAATPKLRALLPRGGTLSGGTDVVVLGAFPLHGAQRARCRFGALPSVPAVVLNTTLLSCTTPGASHKASPLTHTSPS